MIALSPRLWTAASMVLPGAPLADIGTDHAYLPAFLVQQGLIPRAIAGDILPGPLEAARATLVGEGLLGVIELRRGSGLAILTPGEVATVAICGMGGPLMVDLLTAGPLEGLQRLVLQPMGGEERLRAWLAEHGWHLVDERLVEDGGRIYVALAAEPGSMSLSEADLLAGPLLRQHPTPLLVRYLAGLLARTRRALAGTARSARPEVRERAAGLQRRAERLEEVMRHAEEGDGGRDLRGD